MDSNDTIRNEPVCRACGERKDAGCLVCWDCFKGRRGRPAFKYYNGTLDAYLIDFAHWQANHVPEGEN